MTTKAKTFDCVAFKREVQEKLRLEYEARKGEFNSFFDFLDAKVQESEWARRMMQKFRQERGSAPS